MTNAKRRCMRIVLTPQCAAADVTARAPRPSDAAQLAHLMLDAYRGTCDDQGETINDARLEVARLFEGEYGDLIPECSEVVVREGHLVAATLVTMWKASPLIAFSMTHPECKRTGLARAGIRRCMEQLLSAGHHELRLVVTRGNTSAERLYESLGFVEMNDEG